MFRIGGDLEVNRLGFGAMRIVGDGVWGPHGDPEAMVELLRSLPGFGVNFIDTADSYGPFVSEDLIREALHPYDGITVATKAGLVRFGPGEWQSLGRPEHLRAACMMSLRRLAVDRIDLFQLHRIDPQVRREEQFAELAALQSEGHVRHLGLSEASVDEIEAAREFFEVATVQNIFNLSNRKHQDVVDFCEAEGIGFIPWYPLAAGDLAEPGGAAAEVAAAHGATTGQIALSWLLQLSPVMLPIPGTSSAEHLSENMAAAEIRLGEEEMQRLNAAA